MGYTHMKKFIVAMLALGLMFGTVGCSSSDDAGEASDNAELAEDATSEISDVASEGDDDFGDDAGGDDEFGDFSDDEAVEGEEVAASDDSAFDDAGGGDTAAAEDELDGLDEALEEEGTELADAPPLEEDPFADDAAPVDDGLEASDSSTGTDDLLADTTEDTTDFSSDETAGLGDDFGSTDSGGFEEAPAFKPLNKMLTTPYRKNGSLVNAIYIARPGDTLESIATKIYGGPRADELRATNGHLASRDVVTGDKIYYNSPQRPADDSQIRVYYEDIGLNPEVYVSQPGDNIRAVGKTLLGDERSWKELWATNMDIDSKDILDEGTRIRYWTGDLGGVAPPQTVAQVDEPPPPPPFEEPPPPPPVEDLAPPAPLPDEAIAANEPPPPPPIEEPPAFEPPPPPPQENLAIQEAPPPPPPVQMPQNDGPAAAGTVDEMMGGDDTMTMILGAIFILAAVGMFIVIRKRKAKKNIEFHTATHTQLE